MQEENARCYCQNNIRIELGVVNILKSWNEKKNTIRYDDKFVKLLLVTIFTTRLLKLASDHSDLDQAKLRFIHGK